MDEQVLPLAEVSAIEAAEALAINTLAPFILCSKLKPLLCSQEPACRATDGLPVAIPPESTSRNGEPNERVRVHIIGHARNNM